MPITDEELALLRKGKFSYMASGLFRVPRLPTKEDPRLFVALHSEDIIKSLLGEITRLEKNQQAPQMGSVDSQIRDLLNRDS